MKPKPNKVLHFVNPIVLVNDSLELVVNNKVLEIENTLEVLILPNILRFEDSIIHLN